jgi:RES domain-containing protein
MPNAWRIVKAKHAATAFSGKGAADHGGRWNSRGVPVVYVSSTKSLAALEILVHLNPPRFFEYTAIPVQFDNTLVELFPLIELPADWQSEPPPPSTQRIGDVWVQEARSAVLGLPSVIIPGELNFVLNPAHPDFKSVSIGKPEPFGFDLRLLA